MMKCIRGILSPSHVDPKNKLGARHGQALLVFLGITLSTSLKTNISEAIISMTDTNSSNSDYQTFNWSTMKTSLILSSYTWGFMITQVPSAYAIKNFGFPTVLSFCLLSCGLVHAVTPLLATEVGWIGVLCARIIIGLFGGCTFTCSQTFIAKWVPPQEKERLGTFVLTGAEAGCFVGILFSGLLAASTLGWPSIFYGFGIVTIAWSIIYYWMGANSPSEHLAISEEEKCYLNESIGTVTVASNLRVPWKRMITSLPMWALIIASCGHNWTQLMYTNVISSYVNAIFDSDIGKSGIMSALPYLTGWIVSFPIGWFFDFIHRNGVPIGVVRKVANTVAFWGVSAIFFIFAYVKFTNSTIVIVLLILGYTLKVGHVSGYMINHVDISPNFVGMTIAITILFGDLIGLFAPIVCGIIVNDTKNFNQWRTYFLITACITFITNCVYIVFSRTDVQDWNTPRISNAESNLNSYPLK